MIPEITAHSLDGAILYNTLIASITKNRTDEHTPPTPPPQFTLVAQSLWEDSMRKGL